MQVVPLTVNTVGELLLAPHVPWKPNVADVPAATFPLKLALVAVTAAPVWVSWEFHALVIF